ncbi:MAG: cupin domain-containing protein [Myxococcota bacterium]
MNGDLSILVSMDTNAMEWQSSPSGNVLRKRLHLVGGAESGQVTSLVRYLPGASFPGHDHPEGEEIFVIEGFFSDQLGDAGPGSHLLNPEGFRHAPYSEEGCLILVKLRQYAGEDRPYQRKESAEMSWIARSGSDIEEKVLFDDARFPDRTLLERWPAGAEVSNEPLEGGAEFYVLTGSFTVQGETHAAGSWIRLPPKASLSARSESGCELYVKTGGVAGLRSDR